MKGVCSMEEPMQILVDALQLREMKWKDILLVTAGIDHPMAILDMAEWVADHPKATWSEIMKEKTRLIRKYML